MAGFATILCVADGVYRWLQALPNASSSPATESNRSACEQAQIVFRRHRGGVSNSEQRDVVLDDPKHSIYLLLN